MLLSGNCSNKLNVVGLCLDPHYEEYCSQAVALLLLTLGVIIHKTLLVTLFLE